MLAMVVVLLVITAQDHPGRIDGFKLIACFAKQTNEKDRFAKRTRTFFIVAPS
jgi:hypothetical protein